MAKQTKEKYPEIQGFCAYEGYKGTTQRYIEKVLELTCKISPKIKDLMSVSKIRWVVERTLAWLNNFRRQKILKLRAKQPNASSISQ